ncbi:MAG: TrmB family transcriptional regulator [Calditrichia bacterium]|nr:TrmB family transcriptional regulator [Calditrichia bacterium]
MTKFDTIKQKVQDLGFTSYEAMAYVSLLENNPVTRYELGKNSGVPRSAIYNAIQKLEQMGAVNAYSSEPEKYVPLPPDQLLEYLERQFHDKIEKAREQLKDFESKIIPDHLWNIVGYDNLIIKVRELIEKAEKSIYISNWKTEFKLFKSDLEEAIARGVEVIIYSFTDIPIEGAKTYCYNLAEKDLEKIWGHKIIVISDKNELVMGEASRDEHKKTVWTKNRALIDIALSHIILDITIYGIRLETDVSETVTTMQNNETDDLGKLLKEKFPNIKF